MRPIMAVICAAALVLPNVARADGQRGQAVELQDQFGNPFGVDANSISTKLAPLSQNAIGGTITAANNTYQLVTFSGGSTPAKCPHGGIMENTNTTAMIYVDWTQPASAAGGTTLSGGAAALGVASTTTPGGKQVIPPTNNPILVYGPNGTVFRGSCS